MAKAISDTSLSKYPKKKIKISEIIRYLVCVVFLVVAMTPFYWTIITALKPADKILTTFDMIPKYFTLEHFKSAIMVPGLLEGLKNTLSITLITMVLNITVSLFAGYALARIAFRGRSVIFKLFLTAMMMPFAVVFVPTFIVLNFLGLTRYSMINLGIALPSAISIYNIFFLRQFFLTLPNELGDSARVDGANELRIFWNIYLPLITPALATLAVFTFQSGWNNYFWPYVLSGGSIKLLTTVLRSFSLGAVADYGGSMAFTLIVTLPMLIIFIFFQRYFMRGISVSGMKE